LLTTVLTALLENETRLRVASEIYVLVGCEVPCNV